MQPVKLLSLASIIIISGCAQVSVHALTPDGYATSKAEGMRYYMPKAYLLVMRIPATTAKTTTGGAGSADGNVGGPTIPPSHIGPPAPGTTPPAAPTGSSTDTSKSPTTSSIPTTDTSFQASSDTYVAKLIYLPDKTEPMAVSASPGIFGTVSIGASLQDGWMLTSLQGSSDAKVAETLTAVASLVSAAYGGGAPKAATESKPAPGSLHGSQGTPAQPAESELLSAGLYDFRSTGICRLTSFETLLVPPATILPYCPQPVASTTTTSQQ